MARGRQRKAATKTSDTTANSEATVSNKAPSRRTAKENQKEKAKKDDKANNVNPEYAMTKKVPIQAKDNKNGNVKEDIKSVKVEMTNSNLGKRTTSGKQKLERGSKQRTKVKEELMCTNEDSDFDADSSPRLKIKKEQKPKPAATNEGRKGKGKGETKSKQDKVLLRGIKRMESDIEDADETKNPVKQKLERGSKQRTKVKEELMGTNEDSDFDADSSPRLKIKKEQKPKPAATNEGRKDKGKGETKSKQDKVSLRGIKRMKTDIEDADETKNPVKQKLERGSKQRTKVKEELMGTNEDSDFDADSSPRLQIKKEQKPKPAATNEGRKNKGKGLTKSKQDKVSLHGIKRMKTDIEDADETENPVKTQNANKVSLRGVKRKKSEIEDAGEKKNPVKTQNANKASLRGVKRNKREIEDAGEKKNPVKTQNANKASLRGVKRNKSVMEDTGKSKNPVKKQNAKKVCAEKKSLAKRSTDSEHHVKSKPNLKDDGGGGDEVEEMSSDDSSESEWEEVEDLPMDMMDSTAEAGPSGDTKPVAISIELSGGGSLRSKRQVKHEEMWRRYLQWQVNKSNKDLQEVLHKAHLVCLLAHGLHSSTLCNDIDLQCIAMSHIPTSMMSTTKQAVDTYYLPKFFKWFRSSFEINAKLRVDTSQPMKTRLTNTLETKKAATENELVHMCILMLRALGLDVRLIISLQPIMIKSIKLTKVNKRLSKSKASKSSPNSSKANCKEPTKKAPHSKTKPICSKFFQSPSDKPMSGSSKLKEDTSTSSSKVAKKREEMKAKQTEINIPKDKSVVNAESSQPHGPRPKNRTRRTCASKVKPIIELSDEDDVIETNSEDCEESETKKILPANKRKQRFAASRKQTKKQPESDSEYEETEQKAIRKPKPAADKGRTKKIRKQSVGHSSVDEVSSDSDFKAEVIKMATGPRTSSSSGEGSAKKVSRKMLSSESDESVEIIKTKGQLNKQGTDQWLEVYSTSSNSWICVDCIRGSVKKPTMCESNASKPIKYVLAFDNEGSIKDVTRRYDSKWMIGTQKLRVDPEWWQETLQPYTSKNKDREVKENQLLQGKLQHKPLPTTISEYKSHPLYALKRHLLKFEALYPDTAAVLGYCRGEPVYARECVHQLHTRQTWLKDARLVRIGEEPYKMVKARPKRNQPTETEPSLEVFGRWQTEDYIPPIAVDGIVPRNEHGNVELFKECMLPSRTVHMRLIGLNRIARKLDIDCAPAMTGWDFHSGFCHPVLDGYVVCEEYEDLLKDAWHKEQQEIEKRKRKKKEETALKNWKLLIKGVLIRERLNKRFQTDPGASTSSSSKTKEKVSWPKNRMTSFEGDKSNRLPFETL